MLIGLFIGILLGFAMFYVGLHIDENFRHQTLDDLARRLQKRNEKRGENA